MPAAVAVTLASDSRSHHPRLARAAPSSGRGGAATRAPAAGDASPTRLVERPRRGSTAATSRSVWTRVYSMRYQRNPLSRACGWNGSPAAGCHRRRRSTQESRKEIRAAKRSQNGGKSYSTITLRHPNKSSPSDVPSMPKCGREGASSRPTISSDHLCSRRREATGDRGGCGS